MGRVTNKISPRKIFVFAIQQNDLIIMICQAGLAHSGSSQYIIIPFYVSHVIRTLTFGASSRFIGLRYLLQRLVHICKRYYGRLAGVGSCRIVLPGVGGTSPCLEVTAQFRFDLWPAALWLKHRRCFVHSDKSFS